MDPSTRLLTIAILSLLGLSLSQLTISSCADVQCIPATVTKCNLVNETYSVLGVARIPSNATGGLPELSWVEGVSASLKGTTYTFHKNFYLSSSPNVDLGSTGACAVFLNQVAPDLKFPSPLDLSRSQGTCEDAMGRDCVTALTARAERLDVRGLSSADACGRLQQDLEAGPVDPACAGFTTTPGKWSGVVARPLSGPQAIPPISAQENGTSNCWPILPKSDSLTLVETVVTVGEYYADIIRPNLFNITPVLTLFFPGNGSNSLVAKSESQLTCMKTVDLFTSDNQSLVGTAPGVQGNGASAVHGYLSLFLVTIFFVVFMAF